MKLPGFILLMLLCSGGSAWSQKVKLKSEAGMTKAALEVDRHVADIFRRKKLAVPKVVDDSTFLRRSFLVAIGRIPTLEEVSDYLGIDEQGKRKLLIRYLLASDGYRSHMQNYVFDLLRARDGGDRAGAFSAPYMEFIRSSVAANKRWDRFAYDLVSATGSAWEKGNGAVGYYIRDKGMPLDTMQIFTGERLECAQCHDSPTNQWERMDFFELAAFTHGQREINQGVWDKATKGYRDSGTAAFRRTEKGRWYYWLRDNIHYGTLSGQGVGRIQLPSDYQYRDGDPGEHVGGKTPFGKRIRTNDRKDTPQSRVKFAKWMTEKNPNFDYIAVNRMWARVMGSPLSEPVDEYVEANKTASPRLVKFLTRLMVDLEYDLKAFQSILLRTKTFQFAANPEAKKAGVPQGFNGRQISRMSAEQIWDSLVTLVADRPERLPKRKFSDYIYYGGRPVLVGKKTMSELSTELTAIKDPRKYRAYVEGLLKEVQKGGQNSGGNQMMMARRSRPGPSSGLARASELEAPAPDGHLLRAFGQSDRNLVEGATKESNVAQVLELMNGQVEKMVVSNEKAAVYRALTKGQSAEDQIRYIFYAILSRGPSEEEMKMAKGAVAGAQRKGYENLVSALLSTREFMFIR